MTQERIFRTYVHAYGGQKVGAQIRRQLETSLKSAVRREMVIADNPLESRRFADYAFRVVNQQPDTLRTRGPRELEQIPPAEVIHLFRVLRLEWPHETEGALLRRALTLWDAKRLTAGVDAMLRTLLRLAREWLEDEAASPSEAVSEGQPRNEWMRQYRALNPDEQKRLRYPLIADGLRAGVSAQELADIFLLSLQRVLEIAQAQGIAK